MTVHHDADAEERWQGLEPEARRNVEAMWLTGRLVPDHKTIADFRKDNLIEGVRFAADSPLEEVGFEPSVPRPG